LVPAHCWLLVGFALSNILSGSPKQRRLLASGFSPRTPRVARPARFVAALLQLRAATRSLQKPLNAPLLRAGDGSPTKPQSCCFSFKTKGHNMSKSSNLPSHRVYAVTKNGKQRYWNAIGVVFPHEDGEGFSVKLNLLPLNGADIVIRKPKADVDPADAVPELANT
jgi:hypothetical protein